MTLNRSCANPCCYHYLWPFYAIILFTWASLYYGVNAILDLEAERANVANALKLADTARLRALQSNLNPHFLFNSLNGIATLVRERDSVTAVAMVDALSTFLRSTLQRLEILQSFALRRSLSSLSSTCAFSVTDSVHVCTRWSRQPAALSVFIPTLILQPLVENAVRYGVLPRESGGSLWVSVRRDDTVLVVSVEDDGPGPAGGTVAPSVRACKIPPTACMRCMARPQV